MERAIYRDPKESVAQRVAAVEDVGSGEHGLLSTSPYWLSNKLTCLLAMSDQHRTHLVRGQDAGEGEEAPVGGVHVLGIITRLQKRRHAVVGGCMSSFGSPIAVF